MEDLNDEDVCPIFCIDIDDTIIIIKCVNG